MIDAAFWSAFGCVGGLLVFFAVAIVALTWTRTELLSMFRRWIDRM